MCYKLFVLIRIVQLIHGNTIEEKKKIKGKYNARNKKFKESIQNKKRCFC